MCYRIGCARIVFGQDGFDTGHLLRRYVGGSKLPKKSSCAGVRAVVALILPRLKATAVDTLRIVIVVGQPFTCSFTRRRMYSRV